MQVGEGRASPVAGEEGWRVSAPAAGAGWPLSGVSLPGGVGGTAVGGLARGPAWVELRDDDPPFPIEPK